MCLVETDNLDGKWGLILHVYNFRGNFIFLSFIALDLVYKNCPILTPLLFHTSYTLFHTSYTPFHTSYTPFHTPFHTSYTPFHTSQTVTSAFSDRTTVTAMPPALTPREASPAHAMTTSLETALLVCPVRTFI